MSTTPTFSVISGAQVRDTLAGREKAVVDLVANAYRLHGEGRTVNPDSYFLRFPDRPSDRIIALPASVRGDVDVHGIKWISSFPGNVADGIPRASAVLILNDTRTGYPFACLESSIISAARTAASAALAASRITEARGVRPRRIGFVGTGLIARYIHTYLEAVGLTGESYAVHDLSPEYAGQFRDYLDRAGVAAVDVHDSADAVLRASDLVVFATVAGEPHVHDPALFGHDPVVLNVSLRDLSPEIILSSYNIVDDVDHCLKANTSPHLAEQATGNRDFLAGTVHDLLRGDLDVPADRPVVFSPFGLGVLDLAVARYVHDQLAGDGSLRQVPDFFAEMKRYG